MTIMGPHYPWHDQARENAQAAKAAAEAAERAKLPELVPLWIQDQILAEFGTRFTGWRGAVQHGLYTEGQT